MLYLVHKQCQLCGKQFTDDKMRNLFDVKYSQYCEKCILQYNFCDHCDNYYQRTCACTTPQKEDEPTINQYNRKFKYKLYSHNNDELFFGIEFEIELPLVLRRDQIEQKFIQNEENKDIYKKIDEIYKYDWIEFKYDGSLSNGVEIVTHPLGWNWIHENIDKIDKIFQLKKYGASGRNNTTCGQHIHINKNYITTFHLYKIMKFFDDNKDFIIKISGRTNNNLKRWATFNRNIKDEAKKKYSNGRGVAINLCNEHTIEFRIFKGTLSRNIFMRNIETVKSLIEYIRDEKINSMSIAGYSKFVNKNKKEYPEINHFLNGDI